MAGPPLAGGGPPHTQPDRQLEQFLLVRRGLRAEEGGGEPSLAVSLVKPIAPHLPRGAGRGVAGRGGALQPQGPSSNFGNYLASLGGSGSGCGEVQPGAGGPPGRPIKSLSDPVSPASRQVEVRNPSRSGGARGTIGRQRPAVSGRGVRPATPGALSDTM